MVPRCWRRSARERVTDTGQLVHRALLGAERRLVDTLDLAPVELPAELANAAGEWKAAPAAIVTRAYAGRVVRYARFAMVEGTGVAIANVLALPAAEQPLPILGADLVAIGARGGSVLLAADLSPTVPEAAGGASLAGLAARRAARPALPAAGELPAWCADWFSPHALFTRVPGERLDEALAALCDFVDEFVRLALSSQSRVALASVAASMQSGYQSAHRTDDKGLGMLGRMFGAEWAKRYVAEVLFPG